MMRERRIATALPPRRDAGLALPLTLWVGVLLALIAGAALDLSRDDLAIARNLAERTRAELAAEGAIALALHRIVATPGAGWPEDGVAAWRVGEAEVRVAAVAETGLVDLNAASPALLSALFAAAGLDAARAERLGAAVEAARRDHAAAWTDETLAPPRFAMVADLGTLPDISRDVLARVAPYLTVYTGLARPDARAAPAVVRAALAPEAGAFANDPDAMSGAAAGRPDAEGVVRLHAEARTDGGALAVRRAVVDLRLMDLGPRDGAAPWRFRLWTDGPRVLFAPPSPASTARQ